MDARGQSSKELNAQAMACLKQGDLHTAKSLLQQAVTLTPDYLPAWTNLAGVLRTLGDFHGALDATDAALKIEPRSFFALFFKGTILEQQGHLKAAAATYAISFIVAPPENQRDANTQKALAQAKILVDKVAAQKAEFLRDQMRDLLPSASRAEQARADILIGNLTGQRRAYVQEPLVFNYPHMPAIEFWDRAEFPWLEAVEAATSDILSELQAVLAQDSASLSPYIHYPDGLPVDQWANLNHNPDWSAYHLIEGGEVVADHAEQCPKTLAALAQVPAPHLPGRSPVALFSILKPHTHIPPHTGASNTRLLCHLPLIVPEKCRFRVGGTWRNWVVGEAFVFDDTIEHEAFNDSDHMRAVLIFDVWNPRLSENDRAIITQITHAIDAFNGTSGQRSDWI